jgi:hypothetical protein
MTSATNVIDSSARRGPARDRVLSASPRFEWAVVGLSTALVVGAHVDAWAHGHIASTLETFFTPWHALLYSAFAATTAFLVVCAAWAGGARPWNWVTALPDGYGLSVVGCALFGIGGVLDMAWHLTFGIERGFQALISPTHLILMVSGGLIVSGPLRAAWRRRGRVISGPAIASATLTLTMLTFFGQFDHPYTSQWAASPQTFLPSQAAEELGMLGIMFQTALLMGVVLMLVRRFELPIGTLTCVMGVNAVFVTLISGPDLIILVGVLGGVAADVAYALLRPSPSRLAPLRIFAFVVPAVLYTLYFRGLIAADGVWWPVHLSAGAPVVAGLTGWLVSILVIPPRVPESKAAEAAEAPLGG